MTLLLISIPLMLIALTIAVLPLLATIGYDKTEAPGADTVVLERPSTAPARARAA